MSSPCRPTFRLWRRLSAAITLSGLTVGCYWLTLPAPQSPAPQSAPKVSDAAAFAPPGSQTAVIAGGCFWGMEALFEHVKGVSGAVSGFSGGSAKTAHYAQVSTGKTGHAEAIKITYDPSQVSYEQLLKVFFAAAHDPTQLNQQGFDLGSQYRSAIFFTNAQQRQTAQAYIQQLDQSKRFYQPIVTQIQPLTAFYAAEDYHQHYVQNHPDNSYVAAVEIPRIERFRERFPELYQSAPERR